jgi:hypothetical protein
VEKYAREHDKSTRRNQALASKLLQVSEPVVNDKVKKLASTAGASGSRSGRRETPVCQPRQNPLP